MIVAASLILCSMGVFAQVTGLTQVKTLRPPGAALMPSAPLVALAGDAAVTAYQGAGPQPWQVWYRYPDTAGINGWSEPTLLAEGSSVSGDQVDISANGNVIAIGSPEAAGGAGEIRMYRTTTAGMTWQLESIIPAPQGISGFGSKVMVRGDLLVETASLTPSVHSFHFDSETQDWLPAGWAVEEIPLSFQFSVATDGERIVFCLTRCTSRVLDENGDWITEAQSDSGGVTDVQISGEWMVGGRNIYHRVGTEWLVTQSIPMVSRFVLSDDSLLVAVQGGGIEIWRNEEGTWQPFASLGRHHTQLALAGDRAIAGIQSFQSAEQIWQPSGSVAGIADPAGYRFGSALGIDDGELRVGMPGSNLVDFWSGAVGGYHLGGTSVLPSTVPLAPVGHIPYRHFGSAIVVSEGLLVVASDTDEPGHPTVHVFDADSNSLLQEITLPDAGRSPLGLTLVGDTLLVGIGGAADPSGVSGVMVYRRQATGDFVYSQTLSEQPEDAGSGFGAKTILRSGWLLTGDVLLHRKDAEADFVRVRHLERPTGLEIAGWTMAADRDTLLVAPVNSTQQLALVYRFEEANGWIPSGEVPRVPPFDDDSDTCAALALSAATGACLLPDYTGLHGLEMLVLRPVVDQSDWAVTESMHVDAPPYGDYSPYVMTSRGAYVALGLPSSGVGGENDDSHMAGGRVIVFLTGEAIFDNGFE